MGAPSASTTRRRLRLQVTGAVQGVGFRPFLYRAATEGGLTGWIRNDTRGVMLELEGDAASLERFRHRVRSDPPPRAVIQEVREEWLPAVGLEDLAILPSDAVGERVAAVLPDLATCDACLRDVGVHPDEDDGPADRRRGYAFTNCTDCGPRFSIIRALPYDRPNTTMAGFELCDRCRAEYEDPLDRRFHAQPTACPDCGPRLWLERAGEARGEDGADAGPVDPSGNGRPGDPIEAAARALARGGILAVKGLGGFHLVVDAADEAAVLRLRARKHRPSKPLAVMVRDLGQARRLCVVSPEAEALMAEPEAPIVLLERRPDAPVAEAVAPGNPYLGLMLPYTPLHHLLMRAVDGPMVATSGNLTDEPICVDGEEARDRLGGIADLFLLHDRPIQRPVDDSVVQLSAGAPRLIRRSRGYAPLPVTLDRAAPPILAVGGHLKNTVALSRGRDVFVSQHIGDLETPQAREAFETVIADFLRLYEVEPAVIAHDLHPDYASSTWVAEAAPRAARRIAVQHHHAHLASCLADTGETRALGVVWDGTGLGTDGTIWGGELLLGDAAGYQRVGHLRPFRLPGGDAAVKEPRRMALALAHAAWGDEGVERALRRLGLDTFGAGELKVLRQVLETGFRAPWTTSAGRLFDGVASLLGLRQRAGFEGEAAMALEYAVDPEATGSYTFELRGPAEGSGALVLDWAPALGELLDELEAGEAPGVVAARFHNGLAAVIGAAAERVGEPRVALTGGVFQNRILTERAVETLREVGARPLLHRRVPANDGGLALGQVAVAAAVQRGEANWRGRPCAWACRAG